MPLVLTIDVEDWAQSTLDTELPITDRAQGNMEHVLDLLSAHDRKATCFVLGKFAERFPATVKRIAGEGHEVASHGYGHVDLFRQKPEVFREDIRRSKRQLEDMTGQEIMGYRAPDFSVIKNALWALEVLAEEGFSYDASINPAVAARFGIPDWPCQPVRVVAKLAVGGGIVELPVATKSLFGRQWPVAGGGYHRLLPWVLIKHLIGSSQKKDKVFMAYCHPYEFDPRGLREHKPGLSWKMRLHQGLGRSGFERKFRNIIRTFDSVLARDVAAADWPEYEVGGETVKR